jgi:hypothetical protein
MFVIESTWFAFSSKGSFMQPVMSFDEMTGEGLTSKYWCIVSEGHP